MEGWDQKKKKNPEFLIHREMEKEEEEDVGETESISVDEKETR